MGTKGILFHAKHAYMPNNLGYCGPDDRGTILGHLEKGDADEDLVGTLQGFEAAYPFLKLIARNSGMGAFDYAVPEAYWIGNDLLSMVDPVDFHDFARRELKGTGMRSMQGSTKLLQGRAIPHHTLYVLNTFAARDGDGANLGNEGARKVAELMDDCRISWGRVKRVSGKELMVSYHPLVVGDDGLALGAEKEKAVKYEPGVKPFEGVKPRDVVSIHWNFACEILTPRQALNIGRYTMADLKLVNEVISGDKQRGRR